MSRYYYSYLNRKKGKKLHRFIKRIFFLSVLFLILLSSIYIITSNKNLDFIKVKKIYIENYTTVPNSLIYDFVIKANIFNYPLILKEMKNKYTEIYKIKMQKIPLFTGELKIRILPREYVFYISKYDNYIFYSRDKKWYKLYNPSEFLRRHNLREVCVNKYLDIDKIYELNNLIDKTKLSNEVYKIEVKDNKEYVLHLKGDMTFVLRENFSLLDDKKISKVFDLLHSKTNRIYGCLLDENIVFYSELK